MAENTKIEWAHHTFSPWRGCTKVAPECAHCYAGDLSKRNPGTLGVWGPNGTRVVAAEAAWREVKKWDRQAAAAGERWRVFPSLCDPFEDWGGPMTHHRGGYLHRSTDGWCVLPELDQQRAVTMDDVRRRMLNLIDATPNLDWLLLTKRPENVRRMWVPVSEHYSPPYVCNGEIYGPDCVEEIHRPNVWLLASAGTQESYDTMDPHLWRCRDLVPVLGWSMEPLLGPVDLSLSAHPGMATLGEIEAWERGRIDWIIAGCESGPRRRAMNPDWAESLALQCSEAGVQFFMKQMELNGKVVGNVEQFPKCLQCRQFPSKDQPFPRGAGVGKR